MTPTDRSGPGAPVDEHRRDAAADPANAADSRAAARTRADVLDAVVGFARDLRRAGVAVPANAAVDAAAALSEVGWTDRPTVRAAMQATLVTRQTDVETFERLFERFWRALQEAGGGGSDDLEELPDSPAPPDPVPAADDPDELDPDAGGDTDADDETGESDSTGASPLRSAMSEADALDAPTLERARYSPAGESEQVSRALVADRYDLAGPVDRLTRALATLPGRRRQRTPAGRYLDARRALRSSVQTGGVVASVPESERADSAVSGVVLVDVSQSVLDSVDRGFLLEWLRLLVDRWRSVRVFFFDTDVREVTAAFDERTVGDVGDALARAEAQWGGGTRIGHALSTLRETYPDAVDRRTVALVVSDGLERGDVDALESSAAWLGRRARLTLWLNPLAASPQYEPTARGMAAALPAVDGLFAFAGPADVTELARQLERHDRRRLGYEYDPRRADGGAVAAADATDGRPTPGHTTQ